VAARDAGKLKAFAESTNHPDKVITEIADFSLQSQIWSLVERLQARGTQIDVLVNNVGIQKRDQILTNEGTIWFDRKERPSHIHAHTPKSAADGADVVRTLESFVQEPAAASLRKRA